MMTQEQAGTGMLYATKPAGPGPEISARAHLYSKLRIYNTQQMLLWI